MLKLWRVPVGLNGGFESSKELVLKNDRLPSCNDNFPFPPFFLPVDFAEGDASFVSEGRDSPCPGLLLLPSVLPLVVLSSTALLVFFIGTLLALPLLWVGEFDGV